MEISRGSSIRSKFIQTAWFEEDSEMIIHFSLLHELLANHFNDVHGDYVSKIIHQNDVSDRTAIIYIRLRSSFI